MIQGGLDGGQSRRQVDHTGLQHLEIVLAQLIAVLGVTRAQQGMNIPARPFPHFIYVAGTQRLEHQIDIGQDLRGGRRYRQQQCNRQNIFLHDAPSPCPRGDLGRIPGAVKIAWSAPASGNRVQRADLGTDRLNISVRLMPGGGRPDHLGNIAWGDHPNISPAFFPLATNVAGSPSLRSPTKGLKSGRPRTCGSGAHDLPHRISPARSQIEDLARTAIQQIFQRQDMRLGQVQHMQIIANRRSIPGFVVLAEHPEGLSQAEFALYVFGNIEQGKHKPRESSGFRENGLLPTRLPPRCRRH